MEKKPDYLFCRGKHEGNSRYIPSVILLDLKLPKVTGLEILKQIRADKRLKSVPVVIFTSSSDQKDRKECLDHGANDFFIKPIDFNAFSNAIKKVINDYLH